MIASLKYEQLPPFCNHYGFVGHSLENCSNVKGRKVVEDRVAVNPKAIGKQVHEKSWIHKEETP